MGRLEYKYLIPNKFIEPIRAYFNPYLELDPYAINRPENQYTVRSIYYDTRNLDSYYNKLAGIRVRKKFRVRGYNQIDQDSLIFLEIKRKEVNVISKNRSPVEYKLLPALLKTGDYETFVYTNNGIPNPGEQAKPFLYFYNRRDLRPAIKIIYEREPFIYKFDSSLRITMDKNLRSSLEKSPETLGSESGVISAIPGYFILEIKTYKKYPKWLRYLIAELDTKHRALSKYTICIDSHRKLGRQVQTIAHHSTVPEDFHDNGKEREP